MTNVLAFPMNDEILENKKLLGDIVISLEAITYEAKNTKFLEENTYVR